MKQTRVGKTTGKFDNEQEEEGKAATEQRLAED
jgi:hypothetical protein